MRVSDIGKILDKTWKVRMNGKNQVPCFSGPSGIGKSQVVHQWCEEMTKQYSDFRMIDLRCALLDPTDFTGLPWKNETLGITQFLPPEFVPKDGHGILFLDEVNRGPTSVMNAIMKLLTERSIGEYKLPDGWIIVTAINPADSDSYDVNTMDAALMNRLVMYNTKFDPIAFIQYAVKKQWSPTVISYLKSGQWIYKEPGQGDGIYIAPRSWEYLSDDEIAGSREDPDLHHETCIALLGKNIGLDYWNFCHKTKPITYADIEKEYIEKGKNKNKIVEMQSYKDFEKYGNPKKAGSYRADLLSASFQSFIDKGKAVDEDILVSVIDIMPVDQSAALLHALAFKHDDPAAWLLGMKSRHADSFARIRSVASRRGTNVATK
jgi:hypothetical protein